FVSPCFYFRLSCDFLLYYQIEYAFYNCPFEDEIMEVMNQVPIWENMKERTFKNGYPDFYSNVINLNDEKFIKVL
uniref:hypothetical protein n=1 Tax=Rubrolithibacter danxiaensis TaxID=3390805 RepID=UPI003BF8E4BC